MLSSKCHVIASPPEACLLLLASSLPNAAVAQDFFGGGGEDDGVVPAPALGHMFFSPARAASVLAFRTCSNGIVSVPRLTYREP